MKVLTLNQLFYEEKIFNYLSVLVLVAQTVKPWLILAYVISSINVACKPDLGEIADNVITNSIHFT